MALYSIVDSAVAQELGHGDRHEIRLLREEGADVVETDGSALVVTNAIAEEMRRIAPDHLVLTPVVVWAPQPRMTERLADRWKVSSSYEVGLAEKCIERDADGSFKRFVRPFVLADQAIPATVGVFAVKGMRRRIFLSETVRDILRRGSPTMRFITVPLVGEGVEPVEDEAPARKPIDLDKLFGRKKPAT